MIAITITAIICVTAVTIYTMKCNADRTKVIMDEMSKEITKEIVGDIKKGMK